MLRAEVTIFRDRDSDLPEDEAINWLDEYIKQRPRNYNSTSLYYKKDGEWVLYKNKVNKKKISKRS